MKTWINLLNVIAFALLITASNVSASTSPTVIPFQLEGKLIIIKAKVDGQPGNFILDTGTRDLVLNTRFFQGKPAAIDFQSFNGSLEEVEVSYPNVELGDLLWKKVYAQIIPMLKMEDAMGIAIHGLIGRELFQNYILMIDYQRLEIVLFPLDKNRDNDEFQNQSKPDELLAFRYKGSAPVITAQIGAVSLKFSVDTGAEMNLMEIRKKKRLLYYVKEINQELVGGFSQKEEQVDMVKVSGLEIGTADCQPMKTAFINLNRINLLFSGPDIDGILGYEFLSQFRVAFHFQKRELYLWNNTPTREFIVASGRK